MSAKMTQSQSFHRLDDEARGRQYEVRITFEVSSWEPGDFTTPGAGGTPQLTSLEVLQVRHYDAQGNVTGVDMGDEARRYDKRAWQLVDEGILAR